MFGHDQPYTIQNGTVVVGEPTLPVSKWMAQPPTCSKWTESTTWWWWITFHAIQKLSNCSHCSSQVYLFLTWYSRGGEERQWSSVCIPRVCHFQRVVMFLIHKLTSLHGDTTRSWLTIPTSSQSRAHCTLLADKKHDHQEQSTTNLKCAVRTQGSHTFIRSTEATPTPGMWQESIHSCRWCMSSPFNSLSIHVGPNLTDVDRPYCLSP